MNRIDAEAADWVARMDGASRAPEDQDRLDAWLAEDVRHVGAYARAQALAEAYVDLHRPVVSAARSSMARLDRRRLLWGGGLAAAGVAGAFLGAGFFVAPETAYATGVGETARLDIGDRGVAMLDAASRATVRRPVGRAPQIELLKGGLSVEATDRLILRCAGVFLATTDAALVLSLADDGAILSVGQGRVSARQDGREIVVGPSQRARLRNGRLEPSEVMAEAEWVQATAWRSGLVALEGTTLEAAAALFARYSDTPIRIGDADAGRRRVTGLFDARDPVGFAEAAAVTTGLKATRTRDGVTLSTPAD